MPKVIGVLTARMASNRLPGKVMQVVAGKTLFAHHVERLRHVRGLDGIFLATSQDSVNNALIAEAETLGCGWYAGSEQDVVERHIALCEREHADAVVRVPCDSPLFDMDSASALVDAFKREYYDYGYVANMTMIQGTVKELVSCKALCRVHGLYKGPAITLKIIENMHEYKIYSMYIDNDLVRYDYRLTVDYPADLQLIRHVYNALYRGTPLHLRAVYAWLDDNPDIACLNSNAGISGVNQYVGNLMNKPLFSIVKQGERHLVLDQQHRVTEPRDFMKILPELFPELKK